jgi:hypothetical protein
MMQGNQMKTEKMMKCMAKFTIVGLWGKYIFKPQSAKYPCLPELEDLTMKMADNQISQK